MDVNALVAKAREKFDTVEAVTQEVLLGDEVVGVRVWPISGPDWRELTAKHPARKDAQFDLNLGYNLDAVVRNYPRVYLVQGDDVQHVEGDEWGSVLDALSGPDLKNIALAVWGQNEFEPQKRLVEAGKALKGGPRKKRSSPAN